MVHERPVHERVHLAVASSAAASGVVRHHLVAEVEAHERRHRSPVAVHEPVLAVVAERGLQVVEVAPRVHRRAEPVDARGVEIPTRIGALARRRHELPLDPPADLGALLPRNREQILIRIERDGLAKRGVARVPHPVVAARPQVTELDVVHTELLAELDRRLLEQGARPLGAGGDAPVDAEGRRDERIAEHQALLARERGQHPAPRRAMKERGLGTARDKALPALHRGGVGIEVECVEGHGGAWCLNRARDASRALW